MESKSNRFSEALYIAAPLHWDGYEIDRLMQGQGQPADWLSSAVRTAIESGSYPKDECAVAAVHFAIQRENKDYGFPCGMNAPADDVGEQGGFRNWTSFYFGYLDALRVKINSHFKLRGFSDKFDRISDDEQCEIATQVIRELIGFRGHHIVASRSGDLDEYRMLARKPRQKDWKAAPQMISPVVLALSFQAHGWAEFMAGANHLKRDGLVDDAADILYSLVQVGLSSNFVYSTSEWRRRALFFMLALRLFVWKDVDFETSREGALFAALYLDFYRRPLDANFTRRSYAEKWSAIGFDEKERYAAQCRMKLAAIRNEAARYYPDCPGDSPSR